MHDIFGTSSNPAQNRKGDKEMPIKNWFLEKNGFSTGNIDYIQQNGCEVARETEKAILIKWGNGLPK